MAQASHLRPGNIIIFRGDLHTIYRAEHRTPGKGRAFVQIKMRNLRSGAMIDQRFSSTEDVERAVLEQRSMEYLYADGATHYFMNTEDYTQIELGQDFLGDAVSYLIPQLEVTVEFHEGKPIGVELPAAVELEVIETEPGLRSATASNVSKPAKLETGLVVQVPPFIDNGEKIRVNTSEGTYLERAK